MRRWLHGRYILKRSRSSLFCLDHINLLLCRSFWQFLNTSLHPPHRLSLCPALERKKTSLILVHLMLSFFPHFFSLSTFFQLKKTPQNSRSISCALFLFFRLSYNSLSFFSFLSRSFFSFLTRSFFSFLSRSFFLFPLSFFFLFPLSLLSSISFFFFFLITFSSFFLSLLSLFCFFFPYLSLSTLFPFFLFCFHSHSFSLSYSSLFSLHLFFSCFIPFISVFLSFNAFSPSRPFHLPSFLLLLLRSIFLSVFALQLTTGCKWQRYLASIK